MFKNIFSEYRATQQQSLEEKAVIDKKADVDGGTRLDQETSVQEKLMTSAERAREMQKKADAAKKKAAAQAARAGRKVEDNTNDKSDDGEGMDKVQPKALKKKFADRKDKDIDNDGDVDSSDEYLHNRRKTVSKEVGKKDEQKKMKKGEKDDVEMNPKMESKIRTALKGVLEQNQNPNAAKAEKPEDALKGKGAKDMMEPAKNAKPDDTEEKGHDDASKAGKVTKPASGRSNGDAVRSGDQKIKGVMAAYQKMKGN